MADPTPAPKKVCTICGEDCSSKPRVKDRRGHYYCKPCHDAALNKRNENAQQDDREAQQAMSAPPQVGAASALDDPAEPSELEALLGAEASAPPAASSVCPGCGQPLAQGAVLCVNCGYNFQSGQQLSAKVEKAPKTRAGQPVWPIIIGVVGLVVALLGISWAGVSVAEVSSAQPPPEMTDADIDPGTHQAGVTIGTAIVAVVALFFVWHGFGSIGVLMRRAWGVTLLRWWSYIAALLLCTCGFLFFGMMLTVGMTSIQEQSGMGLTVGVVLALVAGFVAAMLAWPVFLIIWFRRDKVRQDISQW